MTTSLTLSASDFKATCLDLMDRAREGSIEAITITKRGRPHITLRFSSPAEPTLDPFGCMKDWGPLVPDDHDWEAPLIPDTVLDEMTDNLIRQLRAD
jgi:prevent-host-death family protein